MKKEKFERKLQSLIDTATEDLEGSIRGAIEERDIAACLHSAADKLRPQRGPVGLLADLIDLSIVSGDKILITIDEDHAGFSASKWTENVPEKPVFPAAQPDSAVEAPGEPPATVVNAVAAIRAIIAARDNVDTPMDDDTGLAMEQIEQLLDKITIVTDADIPAYLRTLAMGARRHSQLDTARSLDAAAEQIERGLHVGLENPEKALQEITKMIGEGNVTAGWWTDANLDLRTCDYAPHVFAGKMMLVVSEVSEAMEGHRKSKPSKIMMDDHLAHRPMVEVEFADAHIRLFDLGANYRLPGGGLLDVPGAIMEKLAYNAKRPDHKPENRAAAGGKTI